MLRIQIASPIRIGVSSQGLNSAGANVKSEGKCALHVMQNALDQREVRLAWIIHEEAQLLNHVR